MVRTTALAILFLGAMAFAQQPSTTKSDAKDNKGTPGKSADAQKPASLDDLITQALKGNADIRVAESKVQEAEAELQRTRLATVQKVTVLYHGIDVARKTRDEAEQRYLTSKRLYETAKGTMSMEELRGAKLTWDRYIAEVTKLEAEMPALLGKMPGKIGQQKTDVSTEDKAHELAADRALRWLAVQQAVGSGEAESSAARLLAAAMLGEVKTGPEGSIADRMRKALDKPIDIDVSDKPMNEVLDKISGLLENAITFRIAPAKPREGATVFHATTLVSVHFSKTPTGAVLQALNDSVPALAFVVRDYGILVCEADSLPPDAVLLHRFWKSGVAESELKNPPVDGEIRGDVAEIDEKAGLVRIRINTEDQHYLSLGKGHTLEVYREGPKPLYLGTIRILDVLGAAAVGKPVGKMSELINKGDKVTSKLSP
jgi:hypothetical protein